MGVSHWSSQGNSPRDHLLPNIKFSYVAHERAPLLVSINCHHQSHKHQRILLPFKTQQHRINTYLPQRYNPQKMSRNWPIDGDNSDIPYGFKRIEYDADARMYIYQKGSQLYAARSNTSPMTPIPNRAASNISPEGFQQGFPNADGEEDKNGVRQGLKRRVTGLTRSITRRVTGRKPNNRGYPKESRAGPAVSQSRPYSTLDEKRDPFADYASDEDERPATTFDEIFAKLPRMNTI
ncbi:hypothetical protein QBC41DRAFT_324900 [Cercophora samala]|uniref:Uncharacterized protein n=1 Tax=Cercophora samala TaxID=330535 RepID=A0AA39Z9Q5_9PEZI|nr:hypothetical protein QBC41DRAFT_324900 [Cercophora samala]